MSDLKQIMDEDTIKRSLTRISHEIFEQHGKNPDVVFVGILTRGVPLAKRLQKMVGELHGCEIEIGLLDITLYRDDLSEIEAYPAIKKTDIPFDVSGKIVILVDDVLFTGRTIRSAMNALIDFGRPQLIELAVLVDRGHRELPIKANYVGKNIPTSKNERVDVSLSEEDDKDEVVVVSGGAK